MKGGRCLLISDILSLMREEETAAITCPHCDRVATAWVQGAATAGGGQLGPPEQWRLLQCSHCRQVSLEWREDFGGGFQDDDGQLIYPAERALSSDVPKGLVDEWTEARTCLKNKSYKACAVMVRRTLEGTCKENGVTERNLANGLKKMLTEGRIDQTLFDWANELRVVGNEGAHYTGKPVSREDAEDALSFAEALLDHIYVLRKRFADFQERRAEARRAASELD